MDLDKLLLVAYAFTCCQLYHCHTINDSYSLLNDKLANYNRKIRPTVNQSAPTEVKFGFQLVSINEFDELQEKLSVAAIIYLNWVDEMIQWNPSDYGDLYYILTDSEYFWIPNFVLTNTAAKLDKIGDDWQSIRYIYNGTAIYLPLGIYTSSCSADITLYPWDNHYCVLSFTPQSHIATEITIHTTSNKVGTDFYSENGAWKILDSRVRSSSVNNYVKVDVELVLERKPRYAVVNVMLPIIFMAFLSNVVFLIPTESGERISYTITMLLAMAVFLTLVGDNLPKTSNPMSYLSYYLITLLAVSVCISLATIFSLRVHHYDTSKPVTGFWTKLPSYMKITCRKTEGKDKDKDELQYTKFDSSDKVIFHSKANILLKDNKGLSTRSDATYSTVRLPPKVRVHPQTIGVNKEKSSISDFTNLDDNVDWKDISTALDKVFFVLFTVILFVATFVYLLLIFTSDRIMLENI